MKTIGLLGGMGPASTVYYYETLCRLMREQVGGNASPKILMHAYDFQEIENWLAEGNREALFGTFLDSGNVLLEAGADFMMIATNTMHQFADDLGLRWKAPLLDIRAMVGARLKSDGRSRPALLGTAYTMVEDFYRDKVAEWAGIDDIMVPLPDEQADLQAMIFEELVKGIITPRVTERFVAITNRLKERGADSVILGCTEIGLVLTEENSPLPAYDSALIHCEEAVEMALADWCP